MKKIISILLAFILTISLSLSVVAQSVHNPSVCKNEPVIIVRGMDFGGLYYDVGTENQRPVLSVDVGKIISTVFKSVFAGIFNWNLDSTVDVICDYAVDLLGGLAMDENGNSIHNVDVIKAPGSIANHPELLKRGDCEFGMVKSCAEEFGADHTYYFTYDWRLDPFEVADEINKTIELACKETGHDTVKIASASMGGIMTLAYLTEYGYDRVSKVLFMSSTFCGNQMPSTLMQGKVKFEGQAIADIALYATKEIGGLHTFLKILDWAGLFDYAEKLAGKIVDLTADQISEKVLIKILSYMPVMWALVQPEDFDACLTYTFGEDIDENSIFIKRIYALRDMIDGRNELLYEMIDNGIDIAVVSNYGSPSIPVYENASKFCGDMVLEARQTSGYATIAPYGKTLGDDYIAKNPEYVSPDNMVDLSTAILPEYTYMIKQAPHVSCSYGTDYNEFFMWLLSYDGEDFRAGVNPDYPQFMMSNGNEDLSKF